MIHADLYCKPTLKPALTLAPTLTPKALAKTVTYSIVYVGGPVGTMAIGLCVFDDENALISTNSDK